LSIRGVHRDPETNIYRGNPVKSAVKIKFKFKNHKNGHPMLGSTAKLGEAITLFFQPHSFFSAFSSKYPLPFSLHFMFKN
jgi:hypothetical protein